MSFEIKAIIFDYGNVLCQPQAPEDVQAIASAIGLPSDEFLELYWRDRIAYDRDDLNAAEYWNRVAGRRLEAAEIKIIVDLDNKSWTRPLEKTVPWVDTARQKGLRTALLSNLPAPLRDALETDVPWLPRFDVRTYSCTVRKAKPDREIYEVCVRDLGIKPPEIVFLDDRPENVTGAAELGIRGILFESPEQAALELRTRFGLTLQDGPRHAR